MPRKQRKEQMTLAQAAELVGGELRGDGTVKVAGVCSLEEQKPGFITFSRRTNAAELGKQATGMTAAALILKKGAELEEVESSLPLLLVDDPTRAVALLSAELHAFWQPSCEVSEKADIHPTASIGRNVSIGAFAVIGEQCVIEDGAVIHPHVVIYAGCRIGAGSVIHSGAVVREDTVLGKGVVLQNGAIIGADGFGYYPDVDGLRPVPQIGNVELSERAEVGANSCVDRATLGTTRIGPNTKIDNIVQIGHNTVIGHNSIVCGHSGISGSCKIGNKVTIAGGVGIADHTEIDDEAVFAAKSGVGFIKRYKKGQYAGHPAIPLTKWRRQALLIEKLPEFVRETKKQLRQQKTDAD